MDGTAPGERALRGATALVLATTMVGLLVWYGSMTSGDSVASSFLEGLGARLPVFGALAGLGGQGVTATSGAVRLGAVTIDAGTVGAVTAGASTTGASAVGSSTSALSTAAVAPVAGGVEALTARVRFVYAISAVAGVWVLLRFYRDWTVDRSTWTVVPRTDDGSTEP